MIDTTRPAQMLSTPTLRWPGSLLPGLELALLFDHRDKPSWEILAGDYREGRIYNRASRHAKWTSYYLGDGGAGQFPRDSAAGRCYSLSGTAISATCKGFADLFLNRPQGTVMVYCRIPTPAATAPILGDWIPYAERAFILEALTTGRLRATLHDGSAEVQKQSTTGQVPFGQWCLLGADWGLDGFSVYVDGRPYRTATPLTGTRATRVTPQSFYLGRANASGDVEYRKAVDFRMFAFWNVQLGVGAQQRMMQALPWWGS